jgi:hypothetical protein
MFGTLEFYIKMGQYAREFDHSVNRIKEIISAYKAEFKIDSEIDPVSWSFKITSKNVARLELSIACSPDIDAYAHTGLYKDGKPFEGYGYDKNKNKRFSNLTELIEEIKWFLSIDSN